VTNLGHILGEHHNGVSVVDDLVNLSFLLLVLSNLGGFKTF